MTAERHHVLDRRLAVATPLVWRRWRRLALWAYNVLADRHRVHAAAGRREHPRHAGDGPAGVGDRGRRRPQGPRRALRQFPEVEMVVGKAGRADTPTDPSPLEMVETVITLRPKEHWPKRKIEYDDAQRQTAVVLTALQDRGLLERSGSRPTAGVAEPRDDERRCPARRDAAGNWCSSATSSSNRRWAAVVRECIAELVRRWRQGGPARRADRTARSTAGRGSWRQSSPRSWRPGRTRKTSTGSCRGSPRSWPPTGRSSSTPERLRYNPVRSKMPTTPWPTRWESSGRRSVRRCTNSSSPARRPLARADPTIDYEVFDHAGRLRCVLHRGTLTRRPEKVKLCRGGPNRLESLRRRSSIRRWARASLPVDMNQVLRRKRAEGRHRPGNGLRRADARLGQHLDPADHQPHRHAGHRRADHDRREGLRQRPGPIQKVSREVAAVLQDVPGAVDVSRPERRQGLPGNHDRPPEGGPLRRERGRHPGRDRSGPGRQGRSP